MNDKKSNTIEAVDVNHTEVVAPEVETNVHAVATSDEKNQYSAIVAAGSWEEKLIVADSMIDGGLVPKSFAGDPGAVISAVEMGLELGLGAWTSLNNIIVISGKATLTLNAMLSLARSKGILINVVKDYDLIPIEVKDKDGKVVKRVDRGTTVVITRGEDIYSPSGKLLDSRISEYTYTKYWSEASKAELTGKDNWKKMPRLMLRARAISEALRLYAADVLLGMYETSEIGDVENIIIDIKE